MEDDPDTAGRASFPRTAGLPAGRVAGLSLVLQFYAAGRPGRGGKMPGMIFLGRVGRFGPEPFQGDRFLLAAGFWYEPYREKSGLVEWQVVFGFPLADALVVLAPLVAFDLDIVAGVGIAEGGLDDFVLFEAVHRLA